MALNIIQGMAVARDKLAATKLSFLADNNYLYALTILITTVIIAKFLVFVVEKYIKRLAKKTKTTLDDDMLNATNKPSFYIIILLGIYFALSPLGIPTNILATINHVIFSVMTIIAAMAIVVIIDILIDAWGKVWAKKTKSYVDDELLPLFHKSSKIFIFVFVFLFVLRIWGINITGFLAGLGIVGIAIGFAIKDSLANIFGGISLILDKTIRVGDRIKLQSGELGEIIEVGLRSTKLKTFDNELLIVPNGSLANQILQNYTLPNRKLRVKVFFGVEYGTETKKVKDVVLKTIEKIENVAKDPEPGVLFIEMADSSLKFQCNIWVEDYKDAYKTKIDATEAIYAALNKSGIGIPFPTRTVYMKKE